MMGNTSNQTNEDMISQIMGNPQLLSMMGYKNASQQQLKQIEAKAKQMLAGKDSSQIMGVAQNLGKEKNIDLNNLDL